MSDTAYGVAAVGLVIVATVADRHASGCGSRARRATSTWRRGRSRRRGTPRRSAGSTCRPRRFLGIAGLILAYGADMLWFPVGYTAGYLVLLVLVAAPLRRSGAYTLPDFAEARTESRTVRRIASILVVTIGWLYLLPQLARRRADAVARDRRTRVGRRPAGRGGRRLQRRRRRHAQHHVRAGVPVLAQADRARRARWCSSARLARRRWSDAGRRSGDLPRPHRGARHPGHRVRRDGPRPGARRRTARPRRRPAPRRRTPVSG